MFSSRGEPFLVTETNAQSIGGPSTNYPAYPGQWRQAAWALVARGARMVEYWHWHTLHYGAETYWGGVLPHSGLPGRAYREIALLGAELARAGGALADAVPDADVAILSSTEARFALAAQPPLQRADGTADPNSYPRIVERVLPRGVRRGPAGAGGPAAVPVRRGPGRRRRHAPGARRGRLLPRVRRRPRLAAGGTPRPAVTSSSDPAPGTPTTRGAPGPRSSPRGCPRRPGAWYDEFSNLDDPCRSPARSPGGDRVGRVPRRRRRGRARHLRPPAPGRWGPRPRPGPRCGPGHRRRHRARPRARPVAGTLAGAGSARRLGGPARRA